MFSSYPDLKLDPLVVPVDGLHLEVDPHRAHKSWRERVVGVAEQEGGFPHAAVSNDQDLEHIVKVLVRSLLLSIGRCCRGHLVETEERKTPSY